MEILSDAEMLRYNRQIILKQFDFEGQEALKQSSILVLGAVAWVVPLLNTLRLRVLVS